MNPPSSGRKAGARVSLPSFPSPRILYINGQPMAAHLGQPIGDFEPQWLAEGGRHRYQMGLSMLCPGHPKSGHRLFFWFANPGDNGPPADWETVKAGTLPRRFWRHGGALAEITLSAEGSQDGEPIEVAGHWRGWVADGRVYSALIQGVAW